VQGAPHDDEPTPLTDPSSECERKWSRSSYVTISPTRSSSHRNMLTLLHLKMSFPETAVPLIHSTLFLISAYWAEL
jgi:hypothetical protein